MKQRRLIQALFASNATVDEWPIRLVYRYQSFQPTTIPAKVAFAVSKRYFPRAHDRNAIKRNLREGYRLNKSELWTVLRQHDRQLVLMFIYTGKKLASFNELQPKIILILKRLTEAIEEA